MSGRKLLHRRRRRRLGTAAAYVIAIGAVLVTLFPLYWLFVISTKLPRDAFKTPPDLIYIPDFSKYLSIWSTAGFGHAFLNSVIVVFGGVTIALLIATPAAYAIIRFRIRGGRWLKLWLLLAYTTPEFLFVIPMYVLYQQFGLFDTQIGLALIYQVFAVPFAVWLVQSFFAEVPLDLADAARVDGCRSSRRSSGSTCRSPRRAWRRPPSSSGSTCGTRSRSPCRSPSTTLRRYNRRRRLPGYGAIRGSRWRRRP